MADENKPAFYPRVGNIKAKNFKPAQPMPFVDDERAMDLPQYGDVDLSVPSKENLELSRRMAERDAQLRRQQQADRSPLEKLAGGVQAGRFLGSALTQAINSAPTRLFKGDEAADKFMQERMYKPEQPLAYEYAGDVGDFLEKLETEYKIPPVLPEAVALQYLTGPATAQASRAAGRGAEQVGRKIESAMEPVVKGAFERGGLPREMVLGMGANTQSNVMKPSNKANWLSGPSIHVPEGDAWRFKTTPIAGETPEQRIPRHEELLNDPTLNQDQLDRVKYQLELAKGEAALDKWADNALMGYFKGQLASPDDPVRLMIERNYANIEAKFVKDQERATKMAQRAEAELDPRKQANMKRQADTMFVQARDDRDVAMQNISHLPSEMLQDIVLDPKSYIKEERVKAGYPAEGLGTTTPSRKWEHQADEAVKVTRAGDIQGAMDLQPRLDKAMQENYAVSLKIGEAFGNLLREKGLDEDTIQTLVKSMPRDQRAEAVGMLDEMQKADSNYLRLLDQDRSFPKFAAQDNPFVAKLDPETKMYSGYMGDLGFEHVMDVLRQDLAAERLRPEQLNKLSVEQAVKRTQEYNLDLARKMNSDRASARANLPVYKDYPNGYKWVQLNQPGNFAAESQAMGHSVKGYEPSKRHPDWVKGSGDEGSDAYGLGGWEAIKSGRAKVYSLVDSRGAPHATIEVASGAHPIGYSFKGASNELPETFEYNRDFDEAFPRPTAEQKQAILNLAQDLFKNNSNIERMDAFQMAANEVLGELPAEIRQIKGKGNAKPVAEYTPYVQDFVKSGKWTDVRDLSNTDLVKYGNEYKSLAEVEGLFKPKIKSALKYLEEHPALETHRQANKAYNEYKGPIPSPEYSSLDYNRGVTVHPNIPYTYNELKAILKDPASFSGRNDEIYDTLSRNLDRIEELKKHYGELPPAAGMKRGGKVSISNNPDTMMLEVNNQKMKNGVPAYGAGKAVTKMGLKAAKNEVPRLAMQFGNDLPLNMNEVENLARRYPSVDRINMNYKDVTKRVPELTEAAQKLQAGELDRETYAKLVQALKPVKPYDFVPKPATAEEARGALREDARDLYGVPSRTLEAGSPVGLRLDIPAYRDSGVWVPTIHEQDSGFGAGKKIGHESVASVLNPEFGMSEKAALSIAAGKPKGTIATIKGDWNPMSEAEVVSKAQQYLKNPEWRQVGMDPERHSFFYDRETMAPVINAEEVIQIGPLVLAKNPKFGKLEDFKYAGGGLTGAIKQGLKVAKPEVMKASEALGKIEGRPLKITQADRTKVGGGYLGGPGFSGLQLTEPEYRAAEAAWAVQNAGTAKTILGGEGDNAVYAAMLGTPTQHQSNQMVFDKLLGDFKKAAKRGELTPELRDLINMRLAAAVDNKGNPVFPANVDIMDKKFRDIADTFSRRSVAGHLMGGVQVGGKKGQIIDYDKIIRSTTDPVLLDQPTGALGNRLFTLSGGIINRPDLHPAFPTILQGEDLGVMFTPVERDIVMKDFVEKTMREKGRKPGYMDYTRGNPPTQLITEDILTELQKLGKKKGGLVKKEGGYIKKPAAYIDGNEFVLAAQKYGIKDSMNNLNKIVDLVNKGLSVDDAARQVADTGMHKAAGGAIRGDDLILEERPL